MIKKFEYFKWNEEVTEKTIDLNELYLQQNSDMFNIVKILNYEFRKETDENINKIITLENKKRDTMYQLDNNIDIVIDPKDGEKILLNLFIGQNSTKCQISPYHNWKFIIKYKKRIFNDIDPYGEEDW